MPARARNAQQRCHLCCSPMGSTCLNDARSAAAAVNAISCDCDIVTDTDTTVVMATDTYSATVIDTNSATVAVTNTQ